MEKISNTELRKYIIKAQLPKQVFDDKMNLHTVIRELNYVQLDTIHVTERAHHHVLWSRFPEYKKEMLDDLMEKTRIFEYWTHAASILPIESFRFTLRRKKNFAWHNQFTDTEEFRKSMIHVYERICNEGALSSSDFDDKNPHPGEMWSWKNSRFALEYLFHQGKLMVVRRDKFRKIFDLTERVFPESRNITDPAPEEAAEFQVNSAIAALGAATEKQITEYLRFAGAKDIKKVISAFIKDGRIKACQYEGKVYYVDSSQRSDIDFHSKAVILSPFDNLIINRQRIKDVFGLDYKLECYLPAKKRIIGFFTMPILYQDKFIGLIDTKADRKRKVLLINNLIELTKDKRKLKKLHSAIEEFAAFNNCSSIDFNHRS